MMNADKMSRHLSELMREHNDVDLVIICIDSEGVDPSVTEERSRPVERRLNRDYLSPPDTLSSITRSKAGLPVTWRLSNPSSVPKHG